MVVLSHAPDAWRLLNGVLCVYKPAGVNMGRLRNMVAGNLCRDLNQMECRPATPYVRIDGDVASGELTVTAVPSYADNVLVVGPKYQMQDVRCLFTHTLGKDISGVIGINRGTSIARKIHEAKYLKTYHVKGRFGQATDTMYTDGKVVEKATYEHVRQVHLDQILGSIQAAHKKLMFESAGVDPNSQTAYELASKGPVRPLKNTPTVIYNIKCVDFSPPDFTLELNCINERSLYLKCLIHDIGMHMKTVATCTQIRCVRLGFFGLEHALLRKHWTIQHILENIIMCKKLVDDNGIYPKSPLLQQPKAPPLIEAT